MSRRNYSLTTISIYSENLRVLVLVWLCHSLLYEFALLYFTVDLCREYGIIVPNPVPSVQLQHFENSSGRGIFFIDAFDIAWLCADSTGCKVFGKEHPLAWEFEEQSIVLVFDDCFEHIFHSFHVIY